MNVAGITGNVRSPGAKSAVSVNRPHPFRQELAVGLLFLIVLPLDFVRIFW
jgi:hypothetical protein